MLDQQTGLASMQCFFAVASHAPFFLDFNASAKISTKNKNAVSTHVGVADIFLVFFVTVSTCSDLAKSRIIVVRCASATSNQIIAF